MAPTSPTISFSLSLLPGPCVQPSGSALKINSPVSLKQPLTTHFHLQPKDCTRSSPSVPLWWEGSSGCIQFACCDHHQLVTCCEGDSDRKGQICASPRACLVGGRYGLSQPKSLGGPTTGAVRSLLARQATSEPSERGIKWPPSLEMLGNGGRSQGELELRDRRKAPLLQVMGHRCKVLGWAE